METKVVPVQVKGIDTALGVVVALVSVFGNVDAVGDRVLPGAFKRTIARWKAKMATGKYMPVVYSHKDDPNMIIGKVVDMTETDEGLLATEQFFMDRPSARAAFGAIAEGVLSGSSFGYGVVRGSPNAFGGMDLEELDVFEVGPTMTPANDATRLVGVKGGSATTKARPSLERLRRQLFGDEPSASPPTPREAVIRTWTPTPEAVRAREANEERREAERAAADERNRLEEAREREEELLLAGQPTSRMRNATETIRVLGGFTDGSWVRSGRDAPTWSRWYGSVEDEVAQASKAAVMAVIAPRIERAKKELEAAGEERDRLVAELRWKKARR